MKNKTYLTGDTHGLYDVGGLLFRLSQTPEDAKKLIVLGDFGVLWNSRDLKHNLNQIKQTKPKNLELLFLAGNHENYNMINSLPSTELHKGEVGIVAPNIFHLKTGEIYEIDGKKIGVFGGGLSIDKMYRKENSSWWSDEIPSEKIMEGFFNKVKMEKELTLLTHVPSIYGIELCTKLLKTKTFKEKDKVAAFLKKLKSEVVFSKHFHGHMHHNYQYNDNCPTFGLYEKIIELD